jgi:Fe-S cluster biogenesis protein NfuA
MDSADSRELQARLQELDALIREVDRFADPEAQAHSREIVRALLDLHRLGLERVLGHVREARDGGTAILDALARDDVVGGLLLLHGLHPQDLETRVRAALEQVRPYLRSHGGNVDLLGVEDGIVRLRLVGNCHGCPSSAVTMRQTIEEAILAKAPDAAAVELEGEADAAPLTGNGRVLVSLPVLNIS